MDALSGIRVIDLGTAIAGPLTTEILALGGAEVIKVETLKRVDTTRIGTDTITGKVFGVDKINEYFAFNDINMNKLSLRLNIRHPKGLELVKKLLKISDVLVENSRPGTMSKIGLTYEIVKEIKPDIIMLSSSTHGGTGPESRGPGWLALFAALSGVSDMTGYPDGPPSETGYTFLDYHSAFASAFAILAALVYRQRTGRGQYIDFASREAASCLIGDSFVDYGISGKVRSREANRDDAMAPHNCYRCKGDDKWVSIAINTEEEWRAFWEATGNPGWAEDEKYADQARRWRNQEELDRLIESWTTHYTPYEVMEVLQRAGVAAMPCFTNQDLFTDPHLTERGAFIVTQHPETGSRFVVSPPWKLSQTPVRIARDAPLFGEHTEYVLGELLHLSKKEIQELADEGVLD